MDPEYVVNTSLPYLTSKLEDAGLTVQLGFNKTERTMFLLLNDSVKCGINQLINELLDAEPDAHHDLMDPWVPYLIERTRIDETILGFGNQEPASSQALGLTTVEWPLREMTQGAVEAMISTIEKPRKAKKAQRLTVPTRAVWRSSVARP